MDNSETTKPVLDHFKGSLEVLLNNMKQASTKHKFPNWFQDFFKQFESFANDLTVTVMLLEKNDNKLESQLAIAKAVTDGLVSEMERLEERINDLEAELEDQRQYSRRTNLLFHGIEEEDRESTDDKVTNVIKNQLGIPDFSLDDISRTHRLGRKSEGKKRPIIARFVSYRKRKAVFDSKKN